MHHKLPFYLQIYEALRREIVSGARAPHSKLPSEHEPVQMCGVARSTVRRALARRQQERPTYGKRAVGYLGRTAQGKGLGWPADHYGWDAALYSILMSTVAGIVFPAFTWKLKPRG